MQRPLRTIFVDKHPKWLLNRGFFLLWVLVFWGCERIIPSCGTCGAPCSVQKPPPPPPCVLYYVSSNGCAQDDGTCGVPKGSGS